MSGSRGVSVPPAARELLAGIVDYAGLFPPASLELSEAARNFESYRNGPDAWALGRFVAPAGRLEELAYLVGPTIGTSVEAPWALSALVGSDVSSDLEKVRAVNAQVPRTATSQERRNNGGLIVDTVELKVDAPVAVAEKLEAIPRSLTAYVEISLERDPGDFIAALQAAGGRPKIRTGGVTSDSFPPPESLLRFLAACVEANLAFKATAGLHHPVAGHYRLTYERDSATTHMYGYLNLLFGTALLRRGAPDNRVFAALREVEATAFRFGEDTMSWREYSFGPDEIVSLRQSGLISFGSCSFREPLDELTASFGPERSRVQPHPNHP
ncbi:MAG: hypothetical protein GEU90_03900 [Gemmatimonas sp.]|nr:hypothetical protein [Gemmatimonas sp.]